MSPDCAVCDDPLPSTGYAAIAAEDGDLPLCSRTCIEEALDDDLHLSPAYADAGTYEPAGELLRRKP